LKVAAEAIYLLNLYSGWSMCPVALWIIFTRILNEILAS